MLNSVLSFLPEWTALQYVIATVVVAVVYAFLLFLSRKKEYSIVKITMAYLLVLYALFVIYKTVISRQVLNEDCNYLFSPFWSYRLPMKFIRDEIIREILTNVIMLMPIGFVMPFVLKKKKVLITVLTGFSLSLFIELSQLALKRGFSEFDDIFHNTIGVLVACLISVLIQKIIDKRKSSV